MSAGRHTWMQPIAATFRSSLSVFAQASTPTPKRTFSEEVSLQFFVDREYNTTVEGVIELVNISGKDISLTQYDMDLPYFTLKNTRIGYVYPKAFLVDMYSRNNSMLFTFKSQYTRPVVVGKNARITFTFSAKLDKPFYQYGGMRILIFPYALSEEGREIRITVSLAKDLPLVVAPQVAASLKEKGIFTVTNETGKVFVFADSDQPFSLALTHNAEIPLPALGVKRNCITFQPVSCVGCGDIVSNGQNGELVAQRTQDAKTVVFQLTAAIDKTCAIQQFAKTSIPQTAGRSFRAGFVLSPITNQLVPATWRVHDENSGTYATSFLASGVPYFYADSFGFLSIPLYSCNSDDDCRARSDSLQSVSTSLGNAQVSAPGITDQADLVSLSIVQHQRLHFLRIKNTTDQFVQLSSIELSANPYFTAPTSSTRVIAPRGSVDLPLTAKSIVQRSNHDVALKVVINGTEKTVHFKPLTITLLALIELLAYLFVVSLGITLVSLFGIIVYTRYYEKRNNTATS